METEDDFYNLSESIDLDFLANLSYGEPPEFFEAYYSLTRFVLDTLLAVVAAAVSLAALAATCCSKSEKTLANLLFVNLVLANLLTIVLAWLCNNVLYLFEEKLVEFMLNADLCRLTLLGLAACLLSTMLGIISTLTLLGFAVNQYIAVNRPLHYTGMVTKKRVCFYLATIWLVSLLTSVAPMVALVVEAENNECNVALLQRILFVLYLSANVGNGIIALVYVAIIGFCIKVYVLIHQLWQRLHHFRQRWELRRSWKALITTALLVGSLSIFFLPFCILHFVSLNVDTTLSKDHRSLVFIMNLLPYLKFITDPVTYGMRTTEVRDGYRRILMRCSRLRKKSKRSRGSLHYTSSFTTSLGAASSSSSTANGRMFD